MNLQSSVSSQQLGGNKTAMTTLEGKKRTRPGALLNLWKARYAPTTYTTYGPADGKQFYAPAIVALLLLHNAAATGVFRLFDGHRGQDFARRRGYSMSVMLHDSAYIPIQ
jgi:hypothetical protein